MADNVTITPGSGRDIATDEVGGVHYQRMKRSVGADGAASDFLDKASRSDTFTTTGSGTAVDVSAQGMSRFALQVKANGGGSPTWSVVHELSLDGTNYTPIMTHDNVGEGDGAVMWSPVPTPALYFRSRCTSLTLNGATSVTATIVGMP